MAIYRQEVICFPYMQKVFQLNASSIMVFLFFFVIVFFNYPASITGVMSFCQHTSHILPYLSLSQFFLFPLSAFVSSTEYGKRRSSHRMSLFHNSLISSRLARITSITIDVKLSFITYQQGMKFEQKRFPLHITIIILITLIVSFLSAHSTDI